MKKSKKEAWFRLFVAIVSGIIFWIWKGLVIILALVNLILVIFTGKKNKEIASFCEYWNTEVYKFIRYLTFVSNKRPFPFSKLEKISKVEKN